MGRPKNPLPDDYSVRANASLRGVGRRVASAFSLKSNSGTAGTRDAIPHEGTEESSPGDYLIRQSEDTVLTPSRGYSFDRRYSGDQSRGLLLANNEYEALGGDRAAGACSIGYQPKQYLSYCAIVLLVFATSAILGVSSVGSVRLEPKLGTTRPARRDTVFWSTTAHPPLDPAVGIRANSSSTIDALNLSHTSLVGSFSSTTTTSTTRTSATTTLTTPPSTSLPRNVHSVISSIGAGRRDVSRRSSADAVEVSEVGHMNLLADIVSGSAQPKEGAVCSVDAVPVDSKVLEKSLLNRSMSPMCDRRGPSLPHKSPHWCWSGLKRECRRAANVYKCWSDLQRAGMTWADVAVVRDSFAPLENPNLCERASVGVAHKWTEADRVAARNWFSRTVRVYVLSQPSNVARWIMISRRLKDLGIQAVRILGLNIGSRDTLELAKIAGWVPHAFELEGVKDDPMSATTTGNLSARIPDAASRAAGHFRSQSRIVTDGYDLGLVLEDDAWVENDFVERLYTLLLTEAPCDWEVISLMSSCSYGRCVSPHLSRVEPDGSEGARDCRRGVNSGMHAVLYRTRSMLAVQAKLKSIVFRLGGSANCLDIDVALASISDRVSFYAVPSCQAPGFIRLINFEEDLYGSSGTMEARVATDTTTTPMMRVLG